MRNTYKYTKLYSGTEPTFSEGDVFQIVVPLNEAATATVGPSVPQVTPQVTPQATPQVDAEKLDSLVHFCTEPRSMIEVMSFIRHVDRKCFSKLYVVPLLESGKIVMTIPDWGNLQPTKSGIGSRVN